jgi:hypothetical protein
MRTLFVALALTAAPFAASAQAPAAAPPPALQSGPQNGARPDPAGLRDASAALAAASKLTLSNSVLTAIVLKPDAKAFYEGVRFDRSGLIASMKFGSTEYYGLWFDQIAADVRDYLFVDDKVVVSPNTGAVGPVDAYDANDPPGYKQAAPGGGFLKIGVGILKKPTDGANYNSFLRYDIANAGAWKVAARKDSVTFTHTLTDAATGFGYVYTKTLRLAPNQPVMTIEHSLKNTGKRAIQSTSFNHNFLTLGAGPTAPGFEVTSGAPLAPQRALGDVATFADGKLRWTRAMAGTDRFLTSLGEYGQAGAPYDVTLRNAAGQGVRIEGDIKMASFTVWGIRRTLAAEPFVTLNAAPGQTLRWRYRYTYMH